MRHHDIVVAAPRDLALAQSAPLILERDDEDFVEAVFEDLRTAEGRAGLAASIATARTADQTLKLFQPVQRRFHVALLEAWCDTPGRPRVDPARIDEAGLVLRRVRTGSQGTTLEGWMRASGRLRGWVAVDRLGAQDADPTPAARLARRATGRPQIDRALAAVVASTEPALLDEHVTPMFVAPPDVCAQAGRTVYFGVVETSSSELASGPPDVAAAFEGFGPGSAEFTEHLVQPLRGLAFGFPDAGTFFDASYLQTLQTATDPARRFFLLLLRQVATEFDAFGASAESVALFAALESITLTYKLQPGEAQARTVQAGAFLRSATAMLLEPDPPSTPIEMPASWPALDAAARTNLAGLMSQSMQARFVAVKGRPGKFDEPDARYVLRAFVRLTPEAGCPPKTIWSDYSEPFVIAPWYEGGTSPAQISLPDVSSLKALKPNVSFLLPPKLQNLLGGDPKKMMDGELDDGGLELGWICSFSIPVITLCAFIVLNIFLSLFDLFFRWMFFLKICIPFPKFKGK
jgi:hypothetical protein